MHELSVAMSLVDVASEEAERRGLQVVAVHLRLGLLSGVMKGALLSAYALACEGSLLEGSTLVISEVPVTAWCPTCSRVQPIESVQDIRCPVCATPTPDIRSGREMEVSGLEIPANADLD